MLEPIILGITQGVAEWLPVSSEGLIFLIKSNFFPSGESLSDVVKLALFLHFGTFLSALVYLRKDVIKLLKTIFTYKKADDKYKKMLVFLVVSTAISGVLGLMFIKGIEGVDKDVSKISKYINIMVGGLLIITATLQIKIGKREDSGKSESGLKKQDGVFLGIFQAFAALPGLSRSGLTVSALLISGFKDKTALKLSFLMSLPIVFAGNIILNLEDFSFSAYNMLALVFSFVFGIITIDILLKIAKKVNFGYFVLGFALLMIVFGLL